MTEESDDETPMLSKETLAALQIWESEKRQKEEQMMNNGQVSVDEDWQLSQFWYEDATARRLVAEVVAAAKTATTKSPVHVACISSPTLIDFFHETEEYKSGSLKVNVFEFDRRFGIKFPDEFIFYDYKNPSELPDDVQKKFDVIVADPPFLAPECLIKVAHTIRLLSREKVKILLCTGAIMENLAERLLGMHRTSFEPRHANNLANEFACFANYPTNIL